MEFVTFQNACDELKHFGVVPASAASSDGAIVRFDMRVVPKITPRVLRAVVHCDDLPPDGLATEGATVLSTSRERLAELAENALHMMHVDEAMLIPSGTWGDIINLIAFELVADETWLEIDAEASLHQRRRDPLVIGAPEMSLVTTMSTSLLKNGDADRADLTIAATGAPLLLELRCCGALRMWCAHEEVRDHLAEIVGAPTDR